MLTGIVGSNPTPSVTTWIRSLSQDKPLCRQIVVPARKRPEKLKPTPPGEDVVAKLDPNHSDEDFLRDLEKATSDEARKRLDLPSGRGRGSSRTSE